MAQIQIKWKIDIKKVCYYILDYTSHGKLYYEIYEQNIDRVYKTTFHL